MQKQEQRLKEERIDPDPNTILKTGPGSYELPLSSQEEKDERIRAIRQLVQSAIPSKSHMALKALADKGYLKYVVSQNTDGLHLKAGISFQNLTELHGNSNIEYCTKCKSIYYRDYRCRVEEDPKQHLTGNKCNTFHDQQQCNGDLADTIVNFGEQLPRDLIAEALTQAQKSDLCLCLGTSLRVRPANQIPIFTQKNNGNVVLVNLQYTPFDQLAQIRIHGFTDQVLEIVCENLGLQIPHYEVKRTLNISRHHLTKKIEIFGTNPFHGNVRHSFISHVEVIDKNINYKAKIVQEPFYMNDHMMEDFNDEDEIVLKIHFFGNYKEPEYKMTIQKKKLRELEVLEVLTIDIKFDFNIQSWV